MMPSEGPALSLTEWVVLALLAEAPSHGFAVARTLSRVTALGEVWTVPRPLSSSCLHQRARELRVADWDQKPCVFPQGGTASRCNTRV